MNRQEELQFMVDHIHSGDPYLEGVPTELLEKLAEDTQTYLRICERKTAEWSEWMAKTQQAHPEVDLELIRRDLQETATLTDEYYKVLNLIQKTIASRK